MLPSFFVPSYSLPEMAYLLLLLAGLAAGVSGQCLSSSDCRTCLSDPRCYYSNSCGYCTSSGDTCNGQSPINNAALCLTVPTAVEAARPLSSAYWTLSIAFVASSGLVVLLYSPLERFCGQRQVAGSAHRGFGCYSYLLLFASWCLWFGFSLSLASPTLPWLIQASNYGTAAATAFNLINCQLYSDGSERCFIFRTLEFLGSNTDLSASDIQYGEEAFALGILGYIVGIGLLFPCVLIASMATYRLRRFEMTGIPPYTSGCSPASLAVAQMLGWPAFLIISIVVFVATGLVSDVANQLNKYRSAGNATVEYLFLPGPVAAGISMTFQFIGLTLVAVVSRALSSVHGVGCNSGGCCRLAVDDGLDPAATEHAAPQDGAPLLIPGQLRPAPSLYKQPPNGAVVPMLAVGSA